MRAYAFVTIAIAVIGVTTASTCSQLGLDPTSEVNYDAVCGMTPEDCPEKKTYGEAAAICNGEGMRLCTAKELKGREAFGTGCGFDRKKVWSEGHCKNGKHYNVNGKYKSSSCCKDSEKRAVRCCADVTERSESAPTSSSSCSDLGWDPSDSLGVGNVCSDSLNCVRGVDYGEAVGVCDAANARLCTIDDLMAYEAAGTGCGYDKRNVWSATPCGPGGERNDYYYTYKKSSKYVGCKSATSNRAVRCCADTD